MTNLTITEYPPKNRRKGVKTAPGRKKIKSKGKSISNLIKECDIAFSKKVRLTTSSGRIYPHTEDSSEITLNYCFTCKRLYPIKKLHCGHYLSRFYKAARWDFDNARPQCMMCNLWKRGDPVVFRQNLVKEIGLERVEAVEAKRNVSIKLTREYLEALLATLSR